MSRKSQHDRESDQGYDERCHGDIFKKPIQTGEFRKNPVEPAWRCPNDYIYELIPTGKFVMEYLKPKQAVTGRVILQLHGGGYIGPMKNIYRRFCG